MANRDQLISVATEITKHMNAFRLAFKTYHKSEFDEMVASVAGEGQRVSGGESETDFEVILLQRGFVTYPRINDSEDGYVRVIRASSIIGNLLNAFRYPGANGDTELARLLQGLRSRRQNDDLDSDPE